MYVYPGFQHQPAFLRKRLKLWGPVVNFQGTQMISHEKNYVLVISIIFWKISMEVFQMSGRVSGNFYWYLFWLFYILGMFGVDKEKHEKRSGFFWTFQTPNTGLTLRSWHHPDGRFHTLTYGTAIVTRLPKTTGGGQKLSIKIDVRKPRFLFEAA